MCPKFSCQSLVVPTPIDVARALSSYKLFLLIPWPITFSPSLSIFTLVLINFTSQPWSVIVATDKRFLLIYGTYSTSQTFLVFPLEVAKEIIPFLLSWHLALLPTITVSWRAAWNYKDSSPQSCDVMHRCQAPESYFVCLSSIEEHTSSTTTNIYSSFFVLFAVWLALLYGFKLPFFSSFFLVQHSAIVCPFFLQ